MDAFWAAPPISRTLAASALLLSVSVYSGLLPGHLVIFQAESILSIPPQIWRLFTSFLITGKELGIIFDTYFSRDNLSLFFSTSLTRTSISVLNIYVTGGVIFTSALVLALAYTSSQDDRGQKASFYFITIPAVWVPYAMLLMNIVMAGPDSAKIQATGFIAAHLHDFLTRLWPTFGGGRNLIPTPKFLQRLWDLKPGTSTQKSYGSMFAPKVRRNMESTSRSSPDALPKSWQNRGSGHRLGGD
ncbi:hypothetical protein EPUL_004912 [Erysiphe pulchra]|uniref:Derlin n=1 Tax=Erysiphe pulchra TaxID=225359 RepID=A0A2S4PMB7_9PEZI|nr:hypothetical protein EPUL_004912 [Erysiphe pulchra]